MRGRACGKRPRARNLERTRGGCVPHVALAWLIATRERDSSVYTTADFVYTQGGTDE